MSLIVTLTTDWAATRFYVPKSDIEIATKIYPSGDHYIAILKASILNTCPTCIIVDVSHRVQLHGSSQAAYLLKSSYPYFPIGSLHIIGVNSEPSELKSLLLVAFDGHYFVAPNDGVLSMVFANETSQSATIIHLNKPQRSSFLALDLISRVVETLYLGQDINTLGKQAPMKCDIPLLVHTTDQSILGRVVFIDNYGNAITNIHKSDFELIGKSRSFTILTHRTHIVCTTLSSYYDEVESGDYLALFNSSDQLELACRDANFALLENLDTNSEILIKFDEA